MAEWLRRATANCLFAGSIPAVASKVVNMCKSRREKLIRYTYNNGYRVTSDGELLNPNKRKLSQYSGSRGYMRGPALKVDGGYYPLEVHVLAAFQKFGDKVFENDIEVRHFNGIKDDNRLSNIGIGTHSDNMMDQPKGQRMRKSKYANEIVGDDKALEIRERVDNDNYDTYEKLAEEYGLKSKGSIHYIINDKIILDD